MIQLKIFRIIKYCGQHRFLKINILVFTIFGVLLLHPSFHHIYLNDSSRRTQFDGFNNETGESYYLVPNIVHLIRFNQTNWTFIDIVLIRAIYRNQKPDAIYIHTNTPNFQGIYWNQLKEKWPETFRIIYIKERQIPTQIYNQTLSEQYARQHGSDIERIRLLSEYGGIYLDNDVFLVNSLDKYRKFEMTLEWPHGEVLGNQVFIAHRNARFLKYYLETYRDYRADLWYYNGGQLPTTAVLHKYPQFIHRVTNKFGTKVSISSILYNGNSKKWRDFDTIHLLLNHRHYMYRNNFKYYPHFDEHTILKYHFSFGQMIREIYFNNSIPTKNNSLPIRFN